MVPARWGVDVKGAEVGGDGGVGAGGEGEEEAVMGDIQGKARGI